MISKINLFFLVLLLGDYMSALYEAYAEYLDRMFDRSDDLVEVDVDSIPDEVDPSLSWLEWADFA